MNCSSSLAQLLRETGQTIAESIGAVTYLLIAIVVVLVISIAWVILPFMLVIRLNRLIKIEEGVAQDQELHFQETKKMLQNSFEMQMALQQAHAETNKALQWIIDDKAAR